MKRNNHDFFYTLLIVLVSPQRQTVAGITVQNYSNRQEMFDQTKNYVDIIYYIYKT